VTKTHIAWRSLDATATFSSPLIFKGHIYLVNRAGVAFCLDKRTGKTVWKQRIGEPQPSGRLQQLRDVSRKAERCPC